jgi:cytochrome c oxidase assembly factor CtaG
MSGIFNFLASNAQRAAYLLAGGMQDGLLGALIALNQHVLYAGYLTHGAASLASVLAGQQLGGMIMWFSGPVFDVALTPINMNGDLTGASCDIMTRVRNRFLERNSRPPLL